MVHRQLMKRIYLVFLCSGKAVFIIFLFNTTEVCIDTYTLIFLNARFLRFLQVLRILRLDRQRGAFKIVSHVIYEHRQVL